MMWAEKLKDFTLTAAVSHEASGLRRSRLTGSSSQTKSEEETVKHPVSTLTLHADYRGQCCVVVGFIQEGLKSLFYLISLLISQTTVFEPWKETEVKQQSSM